MPRFPDSKRIHRALFGVSYEEDIYEIFCARLPFVMRSFGWRIAPEVLARKLIFIHVPRAAGTSISTALFGPRNTLHYSIRYYRTVNPRFYAEAESFAVLRDPMDRFISSYTFIRAGGTDTVELADVFLEETRHIRSVDDYLSYLEARTPLQMDFVMRPQSWFICDLATGAPLVKKLFLLGEDSERLEHFLRGLGVAKLPHLNPSNRRPLDLTAQQTARIERLYAADYALIARLRAGRGASAGLAAE